MENYAPMAVPQPKMDPTDLIHMENLLKRNCYGRIIGIHLYDVGHIVPPVLYNWVETHVLRRFLAFGFLACKQDVGVAIPIDFRRRASSSVRAKLQHGDAGSRLRSLASRTF